MSDDATTRILTALPALGGAIESLGGRLDRLEEAAFQRLDRLEAGQKAVTERLGRLEAARNNLRDDYAVNFGASDAVKRANENTREESRSPSEMVFTLVRQLRAVSTRVDQLEEKR